MADWSQYEESPDEKYKKYDAGRSPNTASQAESAIRGFSNAATFGLAPRISAAVNTGLGKIAPDSFGTESYDERVKTYLDADKTAQESNPKTSLAASAFPMLVQAFATGGGSLARQGAVNAGMGAVNAAGNSRGETVGDVMKDAAKGGATSAAFATVPGMAGKATNFVAKKVTSNIVSDPVERLLATKPKGWEDEIAKYMGESKKTLRENFGSMEKAGVEFLDTLKSTGKSGTTNVQLSDLPQATQKIIDTNVPTLKQVGKEAIRTTVDAGVGAAGGAGLNYALGSPVDPVTAALGGAAWHGKGQALNFSTEAGKKMLMSTARSPLPEQAGNFIARNNRAVGATNQMASQAVGGESSEAGGFRKLTDYLKGVPEDEKRKEAMKLQATPEGRAVSNDTDKDKWGQYEAKE